MHVFVVDSDKKPLMPCHPAVARKLLRNGSAAVFRRYPFTLILRRQEDPVSPGIRLKIDPGSKVTGMALVQNSQEGGKAIWLGEITHRGQRIRAKLEARRALRRGRRSRKTRYRKARFLNRRRPEGWLAPSLNSRVYNVMTWVNRLRRLVPISAISMELVRFDTQRLMNPEISGVEYQQGELLGYEVREYLLEKWGRRCAYCLAEEIPLEIEHVVPRSRGGSDRVSNLTLSCRACNEKKGNQTAAEFGFPGIGARAEHPLRDAAAINSVRWALYRSLEATGLPVEVGTGGRTKFNRTRHALPKAHCLDAACVGAITPDRLEVSDTNVLAIKAMGHGVRQRCRTDKYGFPARHAPKAKYYRGFTTGDIVKATVPPGLKSSGTHIARIAIRFSPTFRVGKYDIHLKYLRKIHGADGYGYSQERVAGSTGPPLAS